MFQTLGPDWFLLFLQPHLHPSTVQLGLVLLTHLLANPSQLSGFREGLLAGTLIESMDEPFALMGMGILVITLRVVTTSF